MDEAPLIHWPLTICAESRSEAMSSSVFQSVSDSGSDDLTIRPLRYPVTVPSGSKWGSLDDGSSTGASTPVPASMKRSPRLYSMIWNSMD
jgi:hypothetical protein